LFLNEVGVLILVHHHVFDVLNDGGRDGRVEEEVVNEFLKVRKIDSVLAKKGLLVALIRLAQTTQERVRGLCDARGLNKFLGDFVEIAADPLDGSPARRPSMQVFPVRLRANDFVEEIEYEEKLGQLVERFVIVAEWGAVAMTGEQAIAK